MSARALTLGIELIDDPAWMGGTLYLRNLAICLSRLPAAQQPQVRLIGPPQVVGDFLAQHGHLPLFSDRPPGLLTRVLRRLGVVPATAPGIDVLYPGFGAPAPGAATVRWVPDFQHRYLPHLFSQAEIEARDQAIGALAAQPGVVVFSSQVAADDFSRFFPGHRATARVWRFCSLLDLTAAPSADVLQTYGLPARYLYLPNQFWAHKNHITVFRTLARLRAQGLEIPLVCTGAQSDRRNEAHFASLQAFIDAQGLGPQIRFLGLIDRGHQVEVLRHAAAIVQPSLFEGWSTVVEDVRASGRPIVLSDLPVHREQDPPHCSFFAPEDDAALADLLAHLWPGLPAGPDVQAEAAAQHAMQARVLEAARTFVEIAETALAIAREQRP
jgi:glycosyltransferase involved in cell wall biosynthesis